MAGLGLLHPVESAGMDAAATSEFYSRLPAVKDFQRLLDRSLFAPAPADWFVVLTDIQGSTQAIREGRYKDVNLVGAATIMAVLNACRGTEIPYVFGGDGATLLVPSGLLGPVRRALGGSIGMARDAFGLTLRAGAVPIQDLSAAGIHLLVAKWSLSPYLSQAIFRGGGLALAETWVKDPEKGRVYRVEPEPGTEADFRGLECRWRPVPARHGEAASILVKALGTQAEQERVYREVVSRIDEIYDRQERPFTPSDLSLSRGPGLGAEAKIRAFGESLWGKLKYRFWLWVQVMAGHWMVSRFGPALWRKYRADVPGNSDARKFDDMFRTVLEGKREKHLALREFLEVRRARGELAFGIHTSREMLITCLVFNREGGHCHFVDGNNGGYALAAVELKKQLSARGGA